MKKNIIVTLLILVVVGIFFLVGSKISKDSRDVAGDKTIKIGSIMPLSGDFAFFGEEILRGEQIAIDDAKADGWNVVFLSEDDHSQPTGTVNAANKLVNVDKVEAVITAVLQQVKPMSGVFSTGKTPLLAVWDSNEYIKSAGDNIFTIGFSTESAGEGMAKYAYENLKLRKVAVIGALDEWSSIISTAFRDKFSELGGQIIFDEQVSPSQKDFRTQIAKIKQLDVDGLYAPLLPTTIAPLLRQMSQLGLDATFMTVDSFSKEEMDSAGGAAEGIYFSNLYADDTRVLDKKYKDKFGVEPAASIFVTFGYDGVKTILAAKEIAVEKNLAMPDALKQVDIDGTDIRIKMDGRRYVEKFERIYQVKGGEFVEVAK